jgi:hypothetical protein
MKANLNSSRGTKTLGILVGIAVLVFVRGALASEVKLEGAELSAVVPDGWHVDSYMLDTRKAIIFTSFPKEEYRQGGVFPPDGMQIIIRPFPITEPTSKLLADLTRGENVVVNRDTRTIRGVSTEMINYRVEMVEGAYTRLAFCSDVADQRVLVQLVYRHGETAERLVPQLEKRLLDVASTITSQKKNGGE